MSKRAERPNLILGRHTYSATEITILSRDSKAKVVIGSFCSIGGNLTLLLGGRHNTDWATTFPFGHISRDIFNTHDGKGHPKEERGITIGNDVWIGGNVTIMGGVTIGDGAIIATNSHVVKNIEPYAIVGGNPATVIKRRFNTYYISKMLDIQWWNFPDETIKELVPLLCSSNIKGFFDEVERRGLR